VKFEALEALNVSPEILAIWSDSFGPDLSSLQERAVKQFGLLSGHRNLIIAAPASSSRALIGEMAAVKAVQSGTKAAIILPHPDLVERYLDLALRYEKIGLKVAVSSRGCRSGVDPVESGDFHVAIISTQTIHGLLVRKPTLLRDLGLLVVDELQRIMDPHQGPGLEFFLARLLREPSPPRLIGLSTVIGSTQILAAWLDARLLEDQERPTELRNGVLCRGRYTYREHNSGAVGTEDFTEVDSGRQETMLGAALEDLALGRQEQVLSFMADRPSCAEAAVVHATNLGLPAAAKAIEELQEMENTCARDLLLQTLEAGVAFLHSDLSRPERRLVEHHFRTGAIRVLFSTARDALGMNLQAQNVIIDPRKWRYSKELEQWEKVPISPGEHEGMCARAGIPASSGSGRAILLTDSQLESKVWMQKYAQRTPDELRPTLKDAVMESCVLHLVSSKVAQTREAITDTILSSLSGKLVWRPRTSPEAFEALVRSAIQSCKYGGLLRESELGLAATELGRACAETGIQVGTAHAFAEWARDSLDTAVTELEVLTVLSHTREADRLHLRLPELERPLADYTKRLLERARAESGRPIFRQCLHEIADVTATQARAAMSTLLMADWIGDMRIRELEERYGIWSGAIAQIGQEFARLTDGLCAVARAMGWPAARCEQIEALAERLKHAAREGMAIRARRAERSGCACTSPEDLGAAIEQVQATLAHYHGAMPGEAEAEHVAACGSRRWVQEGGSESGEPAAFMGEATPLPANTVKATDADVADLAGKAVLCIVVPEHRVRYRGVEIPTKGTNGLQPQLFSALTVLALSSGKLVTMAEMAEGIFALGGLPKKPVAPEQRDLRYRILRAFRHALEPYGVQGHEIEGLIESVTGVGLRLVVGGSIEVVQWGGRSIPSAHASAVKSARENETTFSNHARECPERSSRSSRSRVT
jgi:replicative superfamily II helicase